MVVPSTWEAGVPFDCIMLVHAWQGAGTGGGGEISLQPQRPHSSLHVCSVQGRWQAGQGGGVASETFTRNPQYMLRLPAAAAAAGAHVMLEQARPSPHKGGAAAALQPIGVYVLETGGCRIDREAPPKSSFQGSLTFTNTLATCRRCFPPGARGLRDRNVQQLVASNQALHLDFAGLDADGDGVISAEERAQGRKALLAQGGAALSVVHWKEKGIDSDGDGCISSEERVKARKALDRVGQHQGGVLLLMACTLKPIESGSVGFRLTVVCEHGPITLVPADSAATRVSDWHLYACFSFQLRWECWSTCSD